jgi:seryl-tRNA(Sec) selenium transferase
MFELQRVAGKRLAELSGAESGMVTSGSAGAMAVATAACIAGSDPKNVWQLPDTTGLKHEVVMLGGRSAFESAIRLAGGKLVLAHGVDDLQAAMNDQTAMVYTTWRDDRLEGGMFSVPATSGNELLAPWRFIYTKIVLSRDFDNVPLRRH